MLCLARKPPIRWASQQERSWTRLNGIEPDDEEWREIIVELVERVVIKNGDSEVVWREAYRPLLRVR